MCYNGYVTRIICIIVCVTIFTSYLLLPTSYLT